MPRRCRDCPRCTESFIAELVNLPFRAVWTLATFWNLGLFRRHCPECGHPLRVHQRVGGRFVD